ncbi:MAG: hypothetical protein P4N59_15575 [Negativicutes bacterium]|nr:hypothetical protein [Negativicutes bacterium]
MNMNWDMDAVLWPTIYLLLALAALLGLWALNVRKKSPKKSGWKEIMAIAVFCLVGALLMMFVNSVGFQLDFTTRLGVVSLILCIYAYYTYRRNKK